MNEFGQRFIGVTVVDIPDKASMDKVLNELGIEPKEDYGFDYPLYVSIVATDEWKFGADKNGINSNHKQITFKEFLSLVEHEERRKEAEAPLRDFQADVNIDRYALDKECEEHSSKYLYWSQILANKKHELDKAKNKLHLIESTANLNYRKNPPEGVKITESTIQALLDTDAGVTKVKDELTDIGHELSVISSVVNALEHKRSELNNLVQLQISGYYSGIKTDSTDDKADKVREQLNEKEEKNNE
jgi:hypothetical protein